MLRRIIPLIMCGGAGTRLWPASREVRPKQFLPLFGARSTFQDTLIRVSDENLFERPIVITNATYRFTVLEQLAEIGAPTLTAFNSGRSSVVFLGIANPPFNDEQEGLGYANRHLPNRDRRRSGVTTLKSACTHGPRFLTGILPPIS